MKQIMLAIALALGIASSASAQCFATTFNASNLDGSTIHIDHNLSADAVIFAVYGEGGVYMTPGDDASIVTGARQVSTNRLDLYVMAGELTYYPSVVYSVRVCN